MSGSVVWGYVYHIIMSVSFYFQSVPEMSGSVAWGYVYHVITFVIITQIVLTDQMRINVVCNYLIIGI